MAGALRAKIILDAEDRASAKVDRAETRWRRFGGFLRTGLVAGIGAAAAAFGTLAIALGKGVAAAQTQEDAANKLRTSLRGLGPAAESTAQALEAQAAAFEATTRFADESVIATQALLAEMGVAPAQLKAATAATVDLAAAFGFSLEQAARNVGRTVGGTAGELGELIPQLREMSAESLRAGAGIDFLADRFRGAAQQDAATFAGALAKLRNSFGTLLEVLGDAVVKNDDVRRAITRLTETISDPAFIANLRVIISRFVRLTAELVEFADKVRRFVTPAVEALGTALRAVGDVVGRFLTPEIVKATQGAELLTTASEQAGRAIGAVDTSSKSAARSVADYAAGAATAATATEDVAVTADAAAAEVAELAAAASAAAPALANEAAGLRAVAEAAGQASIRMGELATARAGVAGGTFTSVPTSGSLPSFEEIVSLSEGPLFGRSLGGRGLDLTTQFGPRIEGLGFLGGGSSNFEATLASLERLRVNRERRL